MVEGNGVVIDLFRNVFEFFKKYGFVEKIYFWSYDMSKFFLELFFLNIGLVFFDLRDNLVLYVFDF